MVTSLVLLAAVFAWPPGSAARLRAARCPQAGRVAWTARWWMVPSRHLRVIVATAGSAAVCGLVLGVAGAVVGALIGIAVTARIRARRQRAAELGEYRAMSEALGALVAELRAGAHPAAAAESVAADAPKGTAAAHGLRAVAAAVRLGGEPDAALVDASVHAPVAADLLARVARAWRVAQAHGVPLAEVLDTVRRDVAEHTRFVGRLHAELAGHRASAAVLAGLPVLGILLGEGMGAGPVGVLSSTPAGQVLLVVGSLLIFAGTAWSERLARRAVVT